MMFTGFRRRLCFFLIAFIIILTFRSFSQEEPSPSETIKKYRRVLQTETDPAKIAEAHYKTGYALEESGNNTEATAEYLKIIVNYPEVTEYSKKAEERLSCLYSGFKEKSEELANKYEITGGEKDPTIFFAYIKSLYENYRNLGQYDRALNVLQRLYDMDPDDPSYLVDIGEIYLRGYNDPDKAIFHFKKAAETSPDNPRIFVDLGMAYEKKEDFNSAIESYSKAVEISTASPWSIYGLRRIDGIRFAEDKRLIKDWFFLGPFDNSDKEGLEKEFPPEKNIELNAVYAGKDGKEIKWLRLFDYEASGYVDLNTLFSPNDYVVAYLLTYVYSPNEREIQFRFGAEDGIKIWLDDSVIVNRPATRSDAVDSDLVKVTLKKGWNKILVKVSDTWGSWGLYFRTTHLNGNPTEDLIFDPQRDNERMKLLYGKIRREKRFKITKIALSYAVAVSIFLFGLYFLISNIHGKIKIRKMKEDFISSVSHELKTPIAAVKMLTETLKRGKIKQDARKEEYYDMIIRESDRLTRFINKILDFSKIEKGGKVFYFEKTNVNEIAKNAVDIFKDEAQDEGLKLKFNPDKDEPLAEFDKDAILQVIFNLMDNAHKYSKAEKEITVNTKAVQNGVSIEVIDKGPGIPKKDIEKIFEKFYRSERDMMQGIKGSGLGLAFVKSVIDAHGGKIAVESEVGKGTKFIIWLPSERA